MDYDAKYDAAAAAYEAYWSKKTKKQLEKELLSWRKYMDKYGPAYAFHGRWMTPPGCLSDGDKVVILKNILEKLGGGE